MRILVFSDTHRRTDPCIRLIKNMKNYIDAVLHAGDVEADIFKLQEAFPDLPIFGVRGNNDFGAKLPLTRTLEFDSVKLFLTHGHTLGVKYTFDKLADAAAAQGASVAVFGHTHQSCDRFEEGIHLLNPGSTGNFWPTYAIIEIENGKVRTDILKLEA